MGKVIVEIYDDYDYDHAVIKSMKKYEEPKTGRWIYTGDYITEGMLKCSECGFKHDVSERFSYCPNCGAKMEVER